MGGDPANITMRHQFRVDSHEFRIQNFRESGTSPNRSKATLYLEGQALDGGTAFKAYVEFVPAENVGKPDIDEAQEAISMYADINSLPMLHDLLRQDPLFVTYAQDETGQRNAMLSHEQYTLHQPTPPQEKKVEVPPMGDVLTVKLGTF